MKQGKTSGLHGARLRALLVIAFLAVVAGGCGPLREIVSPTAPAVTGQWAELVRDIRVFERDIGFAATDNFADLARGQAAFPVCGFVSPLVLPYSYEDAAIQWRDVTTEDECRAQAQDADMHFHEVEAWGEIGVSITPSMLSGKLDRFIYVVIHEDCHDQFALPYGIEEALCDVITHKAMAAFATQTYGAGSHEERAIRRYADAQAKLARALIAIYGRLAALYTRHAQREITADELLRERTAIFGDAGSELGWKSNRINNAGIADHMTYSRHYPLLESVYEALGRDLARTVAFFKRVDEAKPAGPAGAAPQRVGGEHSTEYIRAYESTLIERVRRALASATPGATARVP